MSGLATKEDQKMKDCTEIVVILDKSSSMGTIKGATIEGFNTFLDEQQKLPGEANLTLVLFDTTYTVKPAKPVKDIKPLTGKTYLPGGCTALLDAMGKAITETGKRLADTPEAERPDKVIVMTMTDGEENSSQEHTRKQIFDMIKHQEEKYKWCFIYLGANVDAFQEAGHIGIGQAQACNYAATDKGVKSAYLVGTRAVTGFRSEGELPANWKAPLEEDSDSADRDIT
jgi:hypothetical protein